MPFTLAAMLALTFSGRLHAHGGLSPRIVELDARASREPQCGTLLFELADILFRNEEYVRSLEVLERLDRTAPGKFFTDKLRASVFLSLGRPAEARAALDRFLKSWPDDVQSVALRARALMALGLKDDAVTGFRDALRRSPAPEPDLVLEAAAALTAAGLPGEALTTLDHGLRTNSHIPSLAGAAIELELSLKKFDAALARVDVLQRSAPRPELWMARRAEILTTAGRINEARSAWRTLIEHLAGLPAAERSSHAMSRFAERARQGLHSLDGLAGIPAAAPVAGKSLPHSTP